MLILALNIAGLRMTNFIEACRNIVNTMTGNLNFPTPSPALADITKAIDALEATYLQGLNGDHAAKKLQLKQRKDVNDLLILLKGYVQATSGDDQQVALSSGINLKQTSQKHSAIGPPSGVRATTLLVPGAVQLNWSGVPYRRSYQVYATTDLADALNPAKWTSLSTVSVPRFQATGLTSGSRYAFIVISTGAHNLKSAPSDPAIATVL